MNSLGILGLIGGAIVILGGFLITAFGKAKKEEGRQEAKLEEAVNADKAKGRADAVLAERRDPDAVDDRLRRGDF